MANGNSTLRHHRFKDLTGKQFGKWTVIAEVVDHPSKKIYWLCRCTCGTEKTVQGAMLTGDRSHGCKPCRKRPHGMWGTPEYVSWAAMNQRCNNANVKAFARYGQNGITVCERWKSFENFYADMGPKPSATHSIDRIDGSLGYSPENCRWATTGEQARNKRTNRLITFNGETMCLTDWASKVGLNIHCLTSRFRKGWSIERALTEPVKANS